MRFFLRSRLCFAMDRSSRIRRRVRRDGRNPERAFPLLHEPLLPRRVGRENRAAAVFRVEYGCAERDEGAGYVVVGRLRGVRAVAAREGDEPEIDAELDPCGRARGDAETHRFVRFRFVACEPHRAQRRARVEIDDLARATAAWERQHVVAMRLPQLRKQRVPEECHLERRLELVLERRLLTGADVRRALRPEPRALGAVSPRGEGREVEQVEPWRPAAGVFADWPTGAKELKVLDPCCCSGHFLVASFELLVALRQREEGLSVGEAVTAVLGGNLFGLVLDPRCTQIAAFALATAAWRKVGGVVELPALQVACCGMGPAGTKEQWLKLADATKLDEDLRLARSRRAQARARTQFASLRPTRSQLTGRAQRLRPLALVALNLGGAAAARLRRRRSHLSAVRWPSPPDRTAHRPRSRAQDPHAPRPPNRASTARTRALTRTVRLRLSRRPSPRRARSSPATRAGE